MIAVGRYQTLPIWRHTRFGAYLGDEDDYVLLPRKEVPLHAEVGAELRVFVYADSEDRPVATTRTPAGIVGDFVCLQAVDTTPIGAFMDWGLEKDLLVPINRQHTQMRRGGWYVVCIALDERTDRLIGSSKIGPYLDGNVSRFEVKQKVEVLVYDVSEIGARVIVEGRYGGMVHPVPGMRKPRIGDRVRGWVQRVREDRLDISLAPMGAQGRFDAKVTLLAALQEAGGFLPLHDGSSPDEIRGRLEMSKKAFKRALGGLYKSGTVELLDGGIRLIEQD